MGCGRSRPRSPSQSREGQGVCEGEREKKGGGKDNKKRDGKRQPAKAGTKQEAGATTNGGTSEVKGNAQKGGVTSRKEGVYARDRQIGEPMGAPSETEVAASKSSVPVPGSTRGQLSSGHKPTSPSRHNANFSLLNGGSHSETSGPSKNKTQTETQNTAADKVQTHAGTAKPFHVTSSQQEFFKMLDEKIEKGADYDSDDD